MYNFVQLNFSNEMVRSLPFWKAPLRPPLRLVDIKESVYRYMYVCNGEKCVSSYQFDTNPSYLSKLIINISLQPTIKVHCDNASELGGNNLQ